jgi:5'-nucleotidase / UDP-sugar diphosphatase
VAPALSLGVSQTRQGQRMLRRFMVPSLAAAMVLGTTVVPAAGQEAGSYACPGGAPDAGFSDVSPANTHHEAINCGVEYEIIRGTTATTFTPGRAVSRGEIATLIARTLDAADADLPGVEGAPNFPDIRSPHADNIRRLAAVGIVQGRDDGTFGQNLAVRRDQMASLFVRAAEFAIGGDLEPDDRGYFPDVQSGVHAENVDLAFELGLVQGRADGNFAPLNPTRRDQAASVVVRFLDGLLELLDSPFDLTVLHVNDGESALLPTDLGGAEGDPGAARFVADLLAAQEDALDPVVPADEHDGPVRAVVTISSGDNFLAGPQLAASFEDPDEFYDAAIYVRGSFDAMTIGNHEFDFGPDVLADFVEAVGSVPFISANLDVSGEPRLAELEDDGLIGASTVVRRAGRDIGIVGATTELLPIISSPRNVTVSDVEEAVQAEVDALRADGAEVVILSSHLQDLNEELNLVPNLSGVDAVVGGGGGEDIRDDYPLMATDADGRDIPVVTTPGRFRDLGQLVLEFDEDGELSGVGGSSQLAEVPTEGPEDPVILEQVTAPVADFVEDLAETVVATTEVPLDGIRNTVRSRETNLGDLLADGMLTTAQDRAATFGVPEADIALQNAGGIRNESILTGDITALDTFNVAPFGNFLAVDTVDGVKVRELVEHALAAPLPAGRFGQWAGIEFRFDLSLPAGQRVVSATIERADGTSYDLVTAGVTNPTAADEDFTIAGLNFTLNGGDGFPFDGSFTTLGLTDQQVLQGYLSSLDTVTAADYPDLTVDFDRYRRFGPVGGTFIED